MNRKEEIKELLKSLLLRANNSIDGNQFSNREESINNSCQKIIDIGKSMEKYIEELKSL